MGNYRSNALLHKNQCTYNEKIQTVSSFQMKCFQSILTYFLINKNNLRIEKISELKGIQTKKYIEFFRYLGA